MIWYDRWCECPGKPQLFFFKPKLQGSDELFTLFEPFLNIEEVISAARFVWFVGERVCVWNDGK